MNNAIPFDTRMHIRAYFNVEVSVYFVIESDSGNILEVQEERFCTIAENLSEGGMKLKLNLLNDLSPLFKVCFNINKFKSIEAYAKLVWKQNYNFGIQFMILDDDSRNEIRKYIEKM